MIGTANRSRHPLPPPNTLLATATTRHDPPRPTTTRYILAIANDALDAVRLASPSKAGASPSGGTAFSGTTGDTTSGGNGCASSGGFSGGGCSGGGFGAGGTAGGQIRQVEAFVAAALSILDKFDLVVHEVFDGDAGCRAVLERACRSYLNNPADNTAEQLALYCAAQARSQQPARSQPSTQPTRRGPPRNHRAATT